MRYLVVLDSESGLTSLVRVDDDEYVTHFGNEREYKLADYHVLRDVTEEVKALLR